MALPPCTQWDVTHLAAKYPWLQVDQKALEEFRSPFLWRSEDTSNSPVFSTDTVKIHPKHRKHEKKQLKSSEKALAIERQSQYKKRKKKKCTIRRNHDRIFANLENQSTNNKIAKENFFSPLTPLFSLPKSLLQSKHDIYNRNEDSDLVLDEILRQEHKNLQQQRKITKTNRKTSKNLRFPLLKPKSTAKKQTLIAKFAQQLKELIEEEEKIQKSVRTRIAQEKSRLPLTFLFECKLLHRSDAQQDGLRKITAIFAKLQHRMLFNSYQNWVQFMQHARREEKQREALVFAQKRAVALLERVSNDAYVGTLAQSFQFWRVAVQKFAQHEQNVAARVIQKAIRARRAKVQLEALRQAAKVQNSRRNQTIRSLLRFERYGTAMRCATLRIGVDFAQQNRAARKLQLFLRRLAVVRRINGRVLRREGANRIQAQWRAHLARQEVQIRRSERAKRLALEYQAATQMQRFARGFLARNKARRRKLWLISAKYSAERLQKWLRHRWFLINLQAKCNARKRRSEEEEARAAAKDCANTNWNSVLAVQCCFRSLFAQKVYHRKLREAQKTQAAIFVQRFWRRRTELHALVSRFAERRERIAQCQLQAAIVLQCAFRCFCAKRKRFALAQDKERRRRAATVLQRHSRGLFARIRYQEAQRALLTIQCSIRSALARRQRSRRISAIFKLQKWIRSICAYRVAQKVLLSLRIAAKRRETSVLLIQKLVRQYEAQQSAKLLRKALNLVQIEQKRYFGAGNEGIGWSSHEASSELLTYVTQRFLDDNSCFSTRELRWLRAQIQTANERLATEDRAAIYLQRSYRGFATRLGFWVHKLQQEERRRLEVRNAIIMQSFARRWRAKKFARRLREERKLAELKEAYIRERKQKMDAKVWKERYEREQMELSVQKAQEAANLLREARREADFARIQAQAAEFRAKKLAAEREIKTLMDIFCTEEKEKSEWVQFADEDGNIYYYNEKTQESSWNSPLKEKKTDILPEKEEKNPENEKPTEIDPLKEILRDGKCVKCHENPSTKRCLDCEDTKRAYYCTGCFLQHMNALNDQNSSFTSKIKHDFEVLATFPARCQSHEECGIDEEKTHLNNPETGGKSFAAYYCYECPTENSSGCFYCESCFVNDHKTVSMLRHAEKALRFRRGALLCCDCGSFLATRQCESCGGDTFCENCFNSSHIDSKRRNLTHKWTKLEVFRDVLERETDRYCVECDVRASSKLCNLCGDGFCDGCFNKTHSKGVKRRHTYLPWSVAAQYGDWLEINDEKATIYYNVETKESTNNRPNLLLSGEERHRLELTEREQFQRSRQLELESEVFKLKEQLRELQDRPVSRAQTPGTTSDTQIKTKTELKPAKRTVLSKIFGRKHTSRTTINCWRSDGTSSS